MWLRRVGLVSMVLLSGALLATDPPMAVAQAQDSRIERRIVTVEDGDYYGHDYQTLRGVPLDQCEQACIDDTACKAFTYNRNAGWCFLKSEAGELKSFSGAIAGRISEVTVRVETLPPPDLSFVLDWILDDAATHAARLRAAPVPQGETARALIAEARRALDSGDPEAAADLFRRAVPLAPGDAAVFTGLARALLAMSPGEEDSYRINSEAVWTAVTAVREARDRTARAEAYDLLAQALERQQRYRPAIEAYKASLKLVDSSVVREAFEELRRTHGFRVVDYSIDSDAPNPRICVQFSEQLQVGRIDFTPFVTLDGRTPPAVTAEGEQLCVDGIRHGERYRLSVRPGVPSVVDETTEIASNFDIYVPDRNPGVRFAGRSFVLPRVGARGVPAVTVNTSQIEIELYRIGARGLTNIVGDGPFLRQLDNWDAERIAEQTGEKIWSGALEVRNELNRDVTTLFPIDEALPERRPGVYVMTARAVGAKQEYWEANATQWFIVSDVGLTTLMGQEGLHVFARSLETARPLAGVTLRLLARNNEVLGEATTDADGHARLAAGLTRGTGGMAPGVLTAEHGGLDFTFLDMTRPGFDLTDRGVAGREAPGPLDVFLYTDRGVYRPGETVNLTALVRDDTAQAVAGLPLTLIVTRPDGVEDRRLIGRDDAMGGHLFALPMIGDAMRGSWTVAAYTDPKGQPVASIDFLVEDFVPDRITFDLTTAAAVLPATEPIEAEVDGRFLYGAPAADLRLEGDIIVAPSSELPDWPGYRFGLADEEVTPVREPLYDLPRTGADGRATFRIAAPALPDTTRPLKARIDVRMREGGGRAVERRLELPIETGVPMLGVRPLFADGSVPERTSAAFDVIALDPSGKRIAQRGVRWELLRVDRSFQWYRLDGSWTYDAVTYTSRVADGRIDLAADQPARLTVDVDWGRYRLEVMSPDPDGPVTSIEFTAGWYVEASDADSPDSVELTLDKPSYRVGDTARVTIAPRIAGTAIVAVIGETVLERREVDVGDAGGTVEFTVDASWAPGAYVTATVLRPMGENASLMPARAVGLAWLGIDMADRTLTVDLDLPEVVRPRGEMSVPLAVGGLAPGQQAYLTVAAVDVGILNLTGFQPPAPETWYYGQRKLAMEMRDIYGALIDGLSGEVGRLRAGGGEAAAMQGSPPTQEPVSLFSGLVTTDADGRATVSFDIPEFNGTLRVMAVAWTRDGVGHGTGDVIVRDPVVMLSSLPRFLAPGDRSRLRIDLDNTDGPAGAYVVSIDSQGPVSAGTPEPAAMLHMAEKQKAAVSVPLTATRIGQDRLRVRLAHESGLEITQDLNIGVRGAEPPLSERRVVSLAPGASLTLDGALVADRIPGSGFVSLSVTRAGALDIPAIMAALDRYPYGCAEQLTSRGMPLLYLSSVARDLGLGTEPELRERIDKAIKDVLAKQSSGGGFGLWGPTGGGDLWLDAYVSEFLTRAREQGHAVPDLAFGQALDHLSNGLAVATDVEGEGVQIAYALYVLARNKRAAISDLRYYADTRLSDFPTALAKAQLGAALALYGEAERARRAFAAALESLEGSTGSGYRSDYGSRLRDGAATLTLVAESGVGDGPIPTLLQVVDAERAGRRYTSTQEDGWMLMAAHALINRSGALRLDVDGEVVEGNLLRRYSGERLEGRPVSIRNTSDHAVTAVLTATGIPQVPRGPEANGFSITRTYYDMNGDPVPVAEVAQNDRFVVVIEVTETSDWPSKVLVVDMLPAGFEIDNPSLVGSADLAGFGWLPDDVNPAHVEFRDDRFVAAFERDGRGDREFSLAYVVRAVSPGSFVHPPVHVEDMYRPYLNARGETGRLEVLGPRP
ncbi:hypothetical protein EDC22_10713 [Tepidamorphus gemmatus]|uniref:Apple domain-containing protein n=2 Tax=Tepidamorphus gemmatus TaxID=747076 RepID=A0A4R3MB99_9HYPH|nr:hypothetical protein EDC22_10713 [Tepidamorphus gemmatus]